MNLPNVCDDTDDGTIVFINWWPILDWMTEGVDMNCLPISGSSIDCSSLTWPENYQSEVINLTDMIIWTYLIHWGRRWRGRISEEWWSSGVCSIAEISKVNKDYLYFFDFYSLQSHLCWWYDWISGGVHWACCVYLRWWWWWGGGWTSRGRNPWSSVLLLISIPLLIIMMSLSDNSSSWNPEGIIRNLKWNQTNILKIFC